MQYKTAFFLGAVSAKLDFLREDLVDMATRYQTFPAVPAEYDNLIESVDKIRGLVVKIYDVENAEEMEYGQNSAI